MRKSLIFVISLAPILGTTGCVISTTSESLPAATAALPMVDQNDFTPAASDYSATFVHLHDPLGRPPSVTITMTNDGWATIRHYHYGVQDDPHYTPPLSEVSVTSQPQHGTVQLTEPNNLLYIGYRASSGYVGSDSFILVAKLPYGSLRNTPFYINITAPK